MHVKYVTATLLHFLKESFHQLMYYRSYYFYTKIVQKPRTVDCRIFWKYQLSLHWPIKIMCTCYHRSWACWKYAKCHYIAQKVLHPIFYKYSRWYVHTATHIAEQWFSGEWKLTSLQWRCNLYAGLQICVHMRACVNYRERENEIKNGKSKEK
jgi:hypothetical protein